MSWSETSTGPCARRKLGPFRLVVGLDRRLVFGERQAEADIAVEVAVGDVVYHLAGRPAVRAIGRVELLRGEPLNRRPEPRRGSFDFADPLRTHLRGDGFRAVEPSDGVT